MYLGCTVKIPDTAGNTTVKTINGVESGQCAFEIQTNCTNNPEDLHLRKRIENGINL